MPTHYDRHEQVLCAVDGSIHIKLVPPIYKQEMYTGKKPKVENLAGEIVDSGESILPNESPVNLFSPDLVLYPLMDEIGTKYSLVLRQGDCLFIPAFYFH